MTKKMKDFWDKLNKTYLCISLAALLIPGLFFLERHWEDEPQVAASHAALAQDIAENEEGISKNSFLVMTSKEQWLEMKLVEICAKYKRQYPCTTDGMADYDKARYLKYEKWLEDQQKKIEKKFGS